MEKKHVERFLEFLIVGIGMGVVEDLLAVKIATGVMIDLEVILIVTLIAIPFAAFSELIVDREDFKFLKRNNK
ncbi:hypothetical protein Metev_2160 [Methanohalobium evestigatum Z-7303]|uniref:Uncharacterized protein n=1 Tax=Methanohalobium evestigatum (strain ATCC BAA-1072 / DSM 3721 / NBRC 107634 / OCM 161 / Z-7303) TaxID=644295 RepID=D7EAI8_METEZ|nr:hypothetical protein [Methanohalobium evestigatum]ADI74987.1 hypothetical protein Metev_2160 [Methanohalobium evestigatum Z-7303]